MHILGEQKMGFAEVIDTCTGVPTRDQIAKKDTASRGVWKPISHGNFVEALHDGIQHHGMKITDSAFALNKSGHVLVGGFKVAGPMLPMLPGGIDGEFELFVRHANDMSLGLQVNAGLELMVCTNGCMSGEIIARHKHTNQFDVNAWARDTALTEFVEDCYKQTKHIENLQTMHMDDGQAAQCILEAGSRELLPLARTKDVWEEWKNPIFSDSDFEPGTAWKLYGDITHVAQKCSPARQLHAVQRASELVREFAV
jgi:hypothetical protein